MDAARGTRRRPHARRVAAKIVAATAVIALTACGAPQRVRTLDGEPDLVGIHGSVPRGFSASVKEELDRLNAACTAIDAPVSAQLPDVAPVGADQTFGGLTDGQCEWVAARPELIIGILANPGGAAVLDQTTTVLKGERPVAGVGMRAVFDPQTRTLYVLENGRLWYLQLVGAGNGVAAPAILTTLGRALVATRAATR
jgi:hypothetical protein